MIPLTIGAIVGIICFFFIPSIIPATNVVVAIIIGAASGLTATCTNQIFKQFNKDKQNLPEPMKVRNDEWWSLFVAIYKLNFNLSTSATKEENVFITPIGGIGNFISLSIFPVI